MKYTLSEHSYTLKETTVAESKRFTLLEADASDEASEAAVTSVVNSAKAEADRIKNAYVEEGKSVVNQDADPELLKLKKSAQQIRAVLAGLSNGRGTKVSDPARLKAAAKTFIAQMRGAVNTWRDTPDSRVSPDVINSFNNLLTSPASVLYKLDRMGEGNSLDKKVLQDLNSTLNDILSIVIRVEGGNRTTGLSAAERERNSKYGTLADIDDAKAETNNDTTRYLDTLRKLYQICQRIASIKTADIGNLKICAEKLKIIVGLTLKKGELDYTKVAKINENNDLVNALNNISPDDGTESNIKSKQELDQEVNDTKDWNNLFKQLGNTSQFWTQYFGYLDRKTEGVEGLGKLMYKLGQPVKEECVKFGFNPKLNPFIKYLMTAIGKKLNVTPDGYNCLHNNIVKGTSGWSVRDLTLATDSLNCKLIIWTNDYYSGSHSASSLNERYMTVYNSVKDKVLGNCEAIDNESIKNWIKNMANQTKLQLPEDESEWQKKLETIKGNTLANWILFKTINLNEITKSVLRTETEVNELVGALAPKEAAKATTPLTKNQFTEVAEALLSAQSDIKQWLLFLLMKFSMNPDDSIAEKIKELGMPSDAKLSMDEWTKLAGTWKKYLLSNKKDLYQGDVVDFIGELIKVDKAKKAKAETTA